MNEPKISDALKEKSAAKSIGGQAVMEGVMMRGKKCYALSVRTPDKTIETRIKSIKPDDANRLKKLPIIRGMFSFVSSMVIGIKTIYDSAEMAGLDDLTEENPTKFDLWLEKKFGDKLYDYVMSFSVVVAIAFSVLLFMVLPVGLTRLISPLFNDTSWLVSLFEGVLRLLIFFFYMLLISKMKEIQRLFAYHGAEHKTIHCYEQNLELTVENVRTRSRLHKRCGTSFLFIVMIISMLVFFFVPVSNLLLRIATRILFVPIIAGISFEVLKWAGRSDSKIVGLLSMPGLLMQKLTTNEPDDGQIEVAIEAVKAVLAQEGEAV